MSEGIFTLLGVDTSSEELNKAVTVSEGGITAAGVYKAVVEKAYVTKSSGGANKVNIEFAIQKEDGSEGKFFYGNYVSSGDEKGNKTTYTNKKTGKEMPLPGLVEVNTFFQAIGVANPDTKKATIELFGEETEVLAMPGISGKKCILGLRHKFDDYKEKDIAYVDTFLDKDGKNSDGDDLLEALTSKIEKAPFKKTKAKASAAPAAPTGGSEATSAGGWS